MKLKNYIAHAVAAVTNGVVSLVAGLLVIWLLGQSSAGAATIELQFSDNLSNNFGDQIDILITTTNAPGPYPSNGSLITDITGTGFLSYNFGPPLGLFKYPVSLTGLPVGFGADNLLFSTFPFIDENGIRLHTDSLFGIFTDFTLRAVPVGNGFRFDLCTSDCISNNVQTLSFTLTPVSDVANTPLPAALPLFATGLGALGLLGWRRKKKIFEGRMKSSITPYTRWLTVAVVAFSSIGILPAAAITIITAPGATQTFATGINDNGTVVGYSSALIFEQAFRYDNGTLTNINPPDANIFGSNLGPRATSINNSGQIVGFSSNANSVHPLGFLYDAGTFTTIAHPLGITRIFGINSNGDMVGTYSGAGLSFLYSGGNFTTIEKPLASNTLVQGINDSGQIVGAYSDGTGSHGFLYDAGVFTTIDNPNAPNTHLLGINNAGQIVGYYPSNFGNFNGFIFDAGVFTPIDINGSPQVIPFDINNVGQIAGAFFYFDPNGGLSSGLRGFVLDVSDATATPLPGALPLMVTGLAGLAFVLRRKRMSLVAQSRAFFTLVAFVVGTLAAAEGAKATTLVDTGTPADPNSPVAVFSKDTTRAAQFTLSGNHTINSVEIFFETRIAGDATLKILSDSANVPGSPLFTQTFNFAVAPEQFVPFSGLGVNLGTGTYWIALFGLGTFEGLGRTQPPNPAPFYAFTIDGVNWSTDTAARFAFRVTGDEVAQTPLPAALPLFTSGLGVLGLLAWGRKKKVAALAA